MRGQTPGSSSYSPPSITGYRSTPQGVGCDPVIPGFVGVDDVGYSSRRCQGRQSNHGRQENPYTKEVLVNPVKQSGWPINKIARDFGASTTSRAYGTTY